MNDHQFRQFIAERPAIHLSMLAAELGIDRVNLYKIIHGLRTMPKAKRGQFLLVAQKYSYPIE